MYSQVVDFFRQGLDQRGKTRTGREEPGTALHLVQSPNLRSGLHDQHLLSSCLNTRSKTYTQGGAVFHAAQHNVPIRVPLGAPPHQDLTIGKRLDPPIGPSLPPQRARG